MSSAAKTVIAGNKAKRKLAPGPKRKALGDQLVPMSRDPIEFLLKIAREHPDIATFKLGPQRTFLLSKPEYIEDVLVANDWNYVKGRGLQRAKKVLGKGLLTSEGNFHRRQRRLSQPAFHKQRIAAYGAVMAEYAGRARDGWKEGETRDIAQEMMQLTLAIVAKTLFDADVQGEAQQIGKALTEVLELFATFSSPLTAFTDKLPTARNRRVKRGKQRLDETIYRIIAEHRAAGEDRGDLLSMLLLAQDAEEGSGGMSDEQLRDEVMTLFLAGHETDRKSVV